MNRKTGLTDLEEESDTDLNLMDLVMQVMARKWVVIAFVAAGLLVGVVVGQLPPDQYRASALVHLERRSQGLELPEILIGRAIGDSGTQRMATESHIIQSRFTLEPVADALNLDWRIAARHFPVIGPMVERRAWPAIPDWILPAYTRHGDRVALDLLEVDAPLVDRKARLVVTGDGEFDVGFGDGPAIAGRVGEVVEVTPGFRFRLSVLDAPPGRVFAIWRSNDLAAVARARRGLSVDERPPTNSGIVDFTHTGPDPERSREIVNAVVRSYQNQNLDRRAAEIDQSIAFIDGQLPEVRAETARAAEALSDFRQQTRVSELTTGSEELLNRIVGIEAELEELRFEEEQLSRRLTPNHPDYRQLLDRRARLEARIEEMREEAADLPPMEQKLLTLRQTLERSVEIERQLASRAEQLNIVRASTVSNINILERAEAAGRIGPNRRTPALAGAALGGLLGILYVLGLNVLRRGIDDSRVIEELGLSLFATINRVDGLRAGGDDTENYALARTRPTDIVVEALRGLRTGLQFSLATAPSKSLMITSPAPSLGKSFVSLNLAIVSAQSGSKVLLIDADLRKGQLRKQFALPRKHQGLSDYLADGVAFETVLLSDPGTGVDFIPTGSYPPNPADLLTAPRFRALLDEATAHYDLVIVDCPPVLAVTDPGIIGQMTGLSLLVVKHLETTRDEVLSSQKILANSGVTLSGAILNQFDASASRYGHYGHRYGYYGGYKYHYN